MSEPAAERTMPEPRPGSELPPRLALVAPGSPPVPLRRRGTLCLGHGPGADLRLDDPYVSRHHAEIVSCGRGHRLVDRGSRNGTWVDGIAIEQAWLSAGMRVRLGRSTLRVVLIDDAARGEVDDDLLLGRSRPIAVARARLRRLAPLPHPVLVRGETGTGKELAAGLLHESGPVAGAPLVAVNCAALPQHLAESELFGHVKGAFTGAHRDHDGAFVQAGGGTLFLDEIAELPLVLQAKLLRVLETRRVRPVGAEREREAPARIVAATHRDLERMVADGEFRADLYHRLGVFSVELPPLRARGADIELLARHFVDLAARELGRPVSPGPDFLAACRRHEWPGNVRELRNLCLRAVALGEGHELSGEDFRPSAPIDGMEVGTTSSSARDAARAAHAASLADSEMIEIRRADYRSMNRQLLTQVVEAEGSVRKAARTLGVPRSTLGAWLRK